MNLNELFKKGENPQLEYGKPTDIDRDTILDKEWLEKNGGFFLDKIKPEGMTKYGFSIKNDDFLHDLFNFCRPSMHRERRKQ